MGGDERATSARTPGLDRRGVLLAGGAAVLAASAPARAQEGAGLDVAVSPDLKTLVRNGYIYALPAMEIARTRDRAFAAGAAANRFTPMRRLAGPADRAVTTPNNDTIYSSAFLDLRRGPVTLTAPETGRRYASLALMDGWSNNVHISGTRTDGGRAVRLVVATRGQAAALTPEAGTQVVVSPTRWMWALSRVLVDGPADLDAAHRIQDAITASGEPGPTPPTPAPPRDAPAAALIAGAAAVIAEVGVLDGDTPALMRIAMAAQRLGLSQDAGGDPARVAEAQAGVDEARALLRAGISAQKPVGGWTYPKPDLGDFGTDYPYRAAVAVAGLAALPPVEAMYMWAAGDGAAGAPPLTFDGRRAWRLDLPPVPVDAFWSLSLYERTPEGGFYFVENPLARYAIGDRTPGLKRDAGGGCTLYAGHTDPGEALRSNWLPAPAGPFALVMRAYLPRPEMLDGRFRLPPVVAA